VTPDFRPHRLISGGHRQTLLGYLCRRRLVWTPPCEDLVVEADADVRLLLRASWQPGPRRLRPALVIVHGLGGCDRASYVLATGLHAWRAGWHVVRMNMRSAGDSLGVCARLYNAGFDGDLLAALKAVAGPVPAVGLVGFSLGGSLALLMLARNAPRLPAGLLGTVAVSPPLDLEACAAALERPANRMYQSYFMGNLREAYRLRQRLRPDLYQPGRERGVRTVRQYDEAITAPCGGYRDAAHYYACSSPGPRLRDIAHPTLILASQDDPMVPADSVARWPLPAPGLVRREMLPTGGHTGFVGRTQAPGRFWAAERALAFLRESGGSTLLAHLGSA
jgi:predicted alpha/beta-fold hydrolase